MNENEKPGHDIDDHKDKAIEIVINGERREVKEKVLSFSQLAALAFNPVPTGPNIVITITYRKGPHENPQGDLLEGQSVHITKGMIFNVTATDKS